MKQIIKLNEMLRDKVVTLYLKTKLRESAGESHTISNVGWCAVAIAVVLLAFTKLPDLFGDYIDSIFSKLKTGLGM